MSTTCGVHNATTNVLDLYDDLNTKICSLSPKKSVIIIIDGKPKCGKTTTILEYKRTHNFSNIKFVVQEIAGEILEKKQTNMCKREIVEKLCNNFYNELKNITDGEIVVFDRGFDSNLMFVNEPNRTPDIEAREHARCILIWERISELFTVYKILVDISSNMLKERLERNQNGDKIWNGVCDISKSPQICDGFVIRGNFDFCKNVIFSLIDREYEKMSK